MKKAIVMAALLCACSAGAPASDNRPVVAAFVRQDCPPCLLMQPWIEQVRRRYGDRVDIAVIDVDEEAGAGLARYFGVIAIPSQVYIDAAGHLVEVNSGIESFEGLDKRIAALVVPR